MPYLNVDDGMPEHPKIDALSDAAFRLHVAGMAYCARRMTDGFVSLAVSRRLTTSGKDSVVFELVKAGVWHDLGAGCDVAESVEATPPTCHAIGRERHYIVHDYLEWNHSKAWWEKRRRDQAERTRKWRESKGESS